MDDQIPSQFQRVAAEIGDLLTAKNAAYGGAFDKAGDFLKILWPNGVPPEKYTQMLALVRIFDKMMRIATDPFAFGEDPPRDIAGYAILMIVNEMNRRNGFDLKEGHDPSLPAKPDPEFVPDPFIPGTEEEGETSRRAGVIPTHEIKLRQRDPKPGELVSIDHEENFS